MKWFRITDAPLQICGLAVKENGQFFRLPLDLIDDVNPGTCGLARQTAGGRVRFRTDSSSVTLRYVVSGLPLAGPNMSILGKSCADLYIDGIFRANRSGVTLDKAMIEVSAAAEPAGTMHDVDIYLPSYNRVLSFDVGVEDGARVDAPRPYAIPDPIVFYGSSITQGAAASRPGIAYTARTARSLDADFINLGFAGNARGEECMARYIAGLKMSAFVFDYDHNAPTAEHLRATHKPFFDIIRSAQPELPVLMLSKPDFHGSGLESVLRTAGLRRDIVKATYEQALADGDGHVAFIDGETVFPADSWDDCTADGCHPNDLGFHYMALAATRELKKLLGK